MKVRGFFGGKWDITAEGCLIIFFPIAIIVWMIVVIKRKRFSDEN
jgi:hypothetical protein